MKPNFIYNYYFNNDELVRTQPELLSIKSKQSVYEVVRIIGGIPLFIEDHFDRLIHSLHLVNIPAFSFNLQNIKHKIVSLCEANETYFGNVEIVVSQTTQNKVVCNLGFIHHKYPDALSYLNGVLVGVIDGERPQPNAKIKNTKTRQESDKFLQTHHFFEVLLINMAGEITEGSRSNFFYLSNNTLYTAPTGKVLPGITRKYVIQAANELNIPFKEQFLASNDIAKIDAAFLSGTSLGILPISHINHTQIGIENNLLNELKIIFNQIVNYYLSGYKLN